jgi:GNAT superfamily N-acetyltransferase
VPPSGKRLRPGGRCTDAHVEKFKLRLATLADLEALVHQRHMMFEDMRHRSVKEHRVGDDSYRRWAPLMMKRRLLRCYVVINSRSEIVAGGCLWLRDVQPGPGHAADKVPYLLSMYTEPAFRRKGLATMIVKECMEWARAKGYRGLTLHASKKGRKVYSELGWERTWEMRYDLE